MATDCVSTNKLNPNQPCAESDGQDYKDFLVNLDYTGADQATVMTKAWWTTGIQGGYIIPLPIMSAKESQDSGAVYESTPILESHVSNGTISRMASIPANTDMYKRLYSLSGSVGTYGIVTSTANGKFRMNKDSDGLYRSFELSVFNVENPTMNDGSVSEKAPIKYSIADPEEFSTQAVVFKPSFNPKSLKALSDVVFTIVSASATEITFTINEFSDNSTVQDNNLVYGITVDDLELLDGSGDAQSIGALSGGAIADDGIYTLTGTAYASGTLGFIDSSEMDETGYNTKTTGTITIE